MHDMSGSENYPTFSVKFFSNSQYKFEPFKIFEIKLTLSPLTFKIIFSLWYFDHFQKEDWLFYGNKIEYQENAIRGNLMIHLED